MTTIQKYGTLIGYFFILYCLIACAQQQPLTGGKKDEAPPRIIAEESTDNLQTNFTKQTLEFVFDEYIQLQNITKQMVISPPLERIPKVTTKLKKLIFEFPEEEVLKENATYAINFGDAVKDLTEGNPVPDFKFIFSTGDYIDSLKVEGTIIDALTGEPVADALYMLYNNLADTVVRTEKPFYFGKTDKDGKFMIENVKAGKYKGFALEDQDLNYLFNIPTERIGFSLDTLLVEADSSVLNITAAIFEPYALIGQPKVDIKQYGLAQLIFKRPPFDARIEVPENGPKHFIETVEDTVKVWYEWPDSTEWNIFVYRDTITDTIPVKYLKNKLPQEQLALTGRRKKSTGPINLNPFKPIKLTFNHPLLTIDSSQIIFTEDSVKVQEETDTFNLTIDTTLIASGNSALPIKATFEVDSVEQRTLSINYNWKEQLQYQLLALPGAFTDLYGLSNTDTINLSYLVKAKNEFGNINLTATGLDSLQQYSFELLLGQNVVATFDVSGATTHQRTFSSLPPGKYSVKVIEDLNKNGRWDSGNYDKKVQPENISTAELEELKANWDVAADIKVAFE